MSSLTSGLGGGMFGSSSPKTDVASVSEEQLLPAAKSTEGTTGSTSIREVAAGCPRFVVAPRDNNITFYEPRRSGDGPALIPRGEIHKTARDCHGDPGPG